MWVWLSSKGLRKLLPPFLLQNQVPTVGLDSHSTLQGAESSIWALQWPIKCLKGLVRNLLAVSRWGVLGWAWLWSATEMTLEQAEERETIDGKSSVLSPIHRHTFTLLFHTHKGITMHMHTLCWPCTLCVWPEFQPEIYKHCFHMFLYVYVVQLGKWLWAHRRELVAFSLLSPISINLQFIFNTRDIESRDMLFLCLSENRYALICFVAATS